MLSDEGKPKPNNLPSETAVFAHAIAGIPLSSALDERDSEEKWIREARSGDLAAFNHLVCAHQDSLYRWSLTLVKDEILAADLTQNTFICAFEVLGAFRGVSFRAWLFHLAYQQRGRVLFLKRRPGRYPAASIFDELPDSLHQVLQLVDLEGLDYRAAASVLQISVGTLQSRLAQARRLYSDLERSANDRHIR